MKYADPMATLPRLLRGEDVADYGAGITAPNEMRERYGA